MSKEWICSAKWLQHIILATACLFILASCSKTKLTSTWMDETRVGQPFNHILIIGIAEKEHNRRLFEEVFTKQLKTAGVNSEVSYIILPKGIKISRDTVTAAIKGRNFDAVIVTHMVDIEKVMVYRQSMNYRTNRGYHNDLYGYYPRVHSYVYEPGYYTQHDVVTLETNLYEISSEKLVWSAHSRTFSPDSAQQVVDELVGLVIKDLAEKGLITKK